MTKYTKDMAQGDWGEYYFAYKVIKTFGWPCRILDIDIGIDAQIEILDKEYNTTGRFIGVQVKTTKKLGIKDKHIAYWRSCEFPIIIVHVDPKSKEMLYCHVDKDRPNKTFKSLVHYDFFDENETDKLRELTFQELIQESKKLLEEISNKLHNINQATDLCSEEILVTDHVDCSHFMTDLNLLRDKLIQCRTIILPIYKAIGDCTYSKVLAEYTDTREQMIRYMNTLELRGGEQEELNIFENSGDFDSMLGLPNLLSTP